MRSPSEVRDTLNRLDQQWDMLMNVQVPPTSEANDIARALNNVTAERNMLKWVLEGSALVYQWVDCTQAEAFKHFLDHYHDDQEESLNEYAQQHYEEWLDTAEPGDEYVVSENDHSLDPYEPEFTVVHVDETEHGHMYQLAFVDNSTALRFGLGWGQVRAGLIAREDSLV
jgi:hypothetical protein